MGEPMTQESLPPTSGGAPLVWFLPPDEGTGVGVIGMQDSQGKNALSVAFVDALHSALHAAATCPDLRVVVLRGLPDVFCAGASLDMLRSLAKGEITPSDILLPRAMFDIPVPVIAAMEGHAIGGGLALGLCADMVLIARESRYGASFMNMGFTPGMGITRLLGHVMSPALANEILFSGAPKKGAFFEGRSGFNAILPREEVLPRAMELAVRIAEKPRKSLEMLKRAQTAPRRRDFEESRTLESLMHEVSFAQPDVLSRIEESYDE